MQPLRFKPVRQRIDAGLARTPPALRWGDRLDVRYYLAYRLSGITSKRVLDVGCGPGLILSAIGPGNRLEGVDSNPEAVEAAKRLVPRAGLKARPWKGNVANVYDVVILANMIEASDQNRFVAGAARALKKGGTLYLTTPNREHPRYRHTRMPAKQDLEVLLAPHFRFRITGWNPFPDPPRFLPARVLARTPGWFELLARLCERGSRVNGSKYLYVEAVKR